jgi:hypothetical protein
VTLDSSNREFSRLLGPYRVRTWLVLLVTTCILPLLLFSAALLLRNSAAEMAATEAQIRERVRLLGEDIDRELARMQAVGEVLALSETLSNGAWRVSTVTRPKSAISWAATC